MELAEARKWGWGAMALPSKHTLNQFLTNSIVTTLGQATVNSYLDYYNSLLTGLLVPALVPLESILNPTAR